MKDNNKIWGTIGTGCNQDGHENSPITAPSGDQQVRLLQRIYGKSGIHPQLIQYIEAHGISAFSILYNVIRLRQIRLLDHNRGITAGMTGQM